MLATKKTTESDNTYPSVFDEITEELSTETAYGLEYILDDIFIENDLHESSEEQPVDWFGLYDLQD